MSETCNRVWPPRPVSWPAILTSVETCLFLRLDRCRTVPQAKRALRDLRKRKCLPSLGRCGGDVLFRLAAIEAWAASQERSQPVANKGVTTAENGD